MNVFTRVLSGACAALVSATLLAGCAGGASGSTPPLQTASATSPMTITLTMPGRSTTAAAGKRIPLYTSIDTKGIGVEYQPHGSAFTGGPNKQPAFGAAIAASATGNAVCTAAAANGAYSCTLYIPSVPAGYDDFRVTLWNAAPQGCTTSGSSCNFLNAPDRALSYASVYNQAILAGISNHAGVDGATPPPNTTNNLGFTLNPVVDNVAVMLNGGIVDGSASNITAAVSVKDAAGNIILGNDSYFDANGNPLTVSLSLVNNCGTSLAFTAPSASPSYTSGGLGNTATVHYDGTSNCPLTGTVPQVHVVTDHALNGSTQDATFNVTQSSAGTTIAGAPQITKVQALGAQPVGFTKATDGNFYIAEASSPYIEQFNPSGIGTAPVAIVSSSTISGIAMGDDGYLWYLDDTNGVVVKQPLGTATSGNAVTSGYLSNNLQDLAAGPDGKMWLLDINNQNVISLAPADLSIVTSDNPFATLTPGQAQPMAVGTFANGDVVACGFTWRSGAPSYMLCRNQTQNSFAPVSLSGGLDFANGLAFGPNGVLYVTTTSGGIQTFTLDATHSFVKGASYAVPGGGNARSIVTGPDGNMWFTISGGTNVLGRIVLSGTGAGTVGAWGGYSELYNTVGVPASTPNFAALAVGSDNYLWALDDANQKAVRIEP